MRVVIHDDPAGVLDAFVAERVMVELGAAAGARALTCLRTAHALLSLASEEEGADLRYAESAAYNVREALNSAVQDTQGGESGFSAAMTAWEQYKVKIGLAGADEPTARSEFALVMDGLATDKERQAYMTTRLLEWFRQQTGVEPLPGEDDPTRHFNRLRNDASRILHDCGPVGEVEALLDETVSWFTRFFAPPSEVAQSLERLAERPYSDDAMAELRSLVTTSHHLRLFLERLHDSTWLGELRSAGLVGPPSPGQPWPVAAVVRASNVPREAVVELLEQLLIDVKALPKPERPASSLDIMRAASELGTVGHEIVLRVLRQYPSDDWAQLLAMSTVEAVDSADPIHVAVADAIIGNESRHDRAYRTQQLLDRIVQGMTPHNVEERMTLIATKIRRLASEKSARYLVLDIAALPVEPDDVWEPVLYAAQCYAVAIPRAIDLGTSGSSLLAAVVDVPGELGERLACQVMANAHDLDRKSKLELVADRFMSETATGDDQALIESLRPFDSAEMRRLRESFGQPSPRPDGVEPDTFGDNWARAWRWSMVLPNEVLTGWEDAVAAVANVHGDPDPSCLATRMSMGGASWGRSPISVEDLASLEPHEAATRIARWSPSETEPWGTSARELARALEITVKADPTDWARDPVALVRALREPVYVDHLLRAFRVSSKEIAAMAPGILEAIQVVRAERWKPAVLGKDNFEYEEDWAVVDTVTVELIDALADADADLADHLPLCWELASELLETIPDEREPAEQYLYPESHDDPLNRAINRPYGDGLQAILALGGWEHRNLGQARPLLAETLTRMLGITEAPGLELRAVIAASRPFVEAIAPDWLQEHQQELFGGQLGQISFDQTLKYSRPTRPFYERSIDQLLGAARRNADHAVAWLLIAYLWDEPGYSYDRIVSGLMGQRAPLREVCSEIARLGSDVPPEQAHIGERALRFTRRLLDDNRERVPAESIAGLGRWVHAPDLEQDLWLELTEDALAATGGEIDHATEVAKKCRDIQPSTAGLRVLAALLGRGDRWEQSYIESIAVDALHRASDPQTADPTASQLRESLIKRGRHEAAEISLPTSGQP